MRRPGVATRSEFAADMCISYYVRRCGRSRLPGISSCSEYAGQDGAVETLQAVSDSSRRRHGRTSFPGPREAGWRRNHPDDGGPSLNNGSERPAKLGVRSCRRIRTPVFESRCERGLGRPTAQLSRGLASLIREAEAKAAHLVGLFLCPLPCPAAAEGEAIGKSEEPVSRNSPC